MIVALMSATGTQAVFINSQNQIDARFDFGGMREKLQDKIDEIDLEEKIAKMDGFGDKLGGEFGEKLNTWADKAQIVVDKIDGEDGTDDEAK